MIFDLNNCKFYLTKVASVWGLDITLLWEVLAEFWDYTWSSNFRLWEPTCLK